MVGSLPSYVNPNYLYYHANSDEVWIKCYAPDSDGSYIDVVSNYGFTVDIETDITLVANRTYFRGYLVTNPTLGDVGYLTYRTAPYLYKIDLGERKVMDDGILPLPIFNLAEQIVYSKDNGHVYVRSTVCYTCGFEGADNGPACGRYGGKNDTVTTGPFASDELQIGQCNYWCDENAKTDIIGLIEIVTSGVGPGKIVARHSMKKV